MKSVLLLPLTTRGHVYKRDGPDPTTEDTAPELSKERERSAETLENKRNADSAPDTAQTLDGHEDPPVSRFRPRYTRRAKRKKLSRMSRKRKRKDRRKVLGKKKRRSRKKKFRSGFCKMEPYNTRKEMCCGSVLYNLTDLHAIRDKRWKCCDHGPCFTCDGEEPSEMTQISVSGNQCIWTAEPYVSNTTVVSRNSTRPGDRTNTSTTSEPAGWKGSSHVPRVEGVDIERVPVYGYRGTTDSISKEVQDPKFDTPTADGALGTGLILMLSLTCIVAITMTVAMIIAFRIRKGRTGCICPVSVQRNQQELNISPPRDDKESDRFRNTDALTFPLPQLPVCLEEAHFQKKMDVGSENCLENVFIDSSTQTKGAKPSNKRTVFGSPFDYTEILTCKKRTFEIPRSNVKLVFPDSMFSLHNSVEVHGFAPSSIVSIRRKFSFKDDEWLTSPTVEYAITGSPEFPEHACVIMPISGSINRQQVWKFESDEGMKETAARALVPRLPRFPSDEPAMDVFYTYTEGDDFIRIYTKGFSGFFCTICGPRDLRLQAYVYGSYERRKQTSGEVSIAAYFIECTLDKCPQYKKDFEQYEEGQNRKCVLPRRVKLLGDDTNPLKDTDLFEVGIECDLEAKHKQLKSGLFCHSPTEVNEMKDVVSCQHQSTDSPYVKDWVLIVGKQPCLPASVKVIVKVTCSRKNQPTDAKYTNIECIINARDMTPWQTSISNSAHGVPEKEELRKYIYEEFSESEKSQLLTSLRKETPCSDCDLAAVLQNLEGRNSLEIYQGIVVRALEDSCLEHHLKTVRDRHIVKQPVPVPVTTLSECGGACTEPGCKTCGDPPTSSVHAELSHTPVNSYDVNNPADDNHRGSLDEGPSLHPELSPRPGLSPEPTTEAV